MRKFLSWVLLASLLASMQRATAFNFETPFKQAAQNYAEHDYKRAGPSAQFALNWVSKTTKMTDRLEALDIMGSSYLEMDDYPVADKSYRVLLKLAQENSKPHYAADALDGLALVCLYRSQFDAARQSLNKSLKLRRTLKGAEGGSISNTYINLAKLSMAEKDYAQATKYLNEAKQVVTSRSGEHSAAMAAVLDEFGKLYELKQNYKAAEETYKKAMSIQQKSLRPHDPAMADTYMGLGMTNLHAKRYHDAHDCFCHALELYYSSLGVYRLKTAAAQFAVGQAHEQSGEFLEASKYYGMCLVARKNYLKPTDPQMIETQNHLEKTRALATKQNP